MSTNLEVFADVPALVEVAARHFARCAREAIAARGAFHVALSGGSTPKPLFARLAGPMRGEIDWSRVHLWWGDERCVPPDAPESNFRMAREAMLDALALPDAQLHRMRGEATDRSAEAARYADELARRLPVEKGVPVFDLMLQGMGADGHTASLFPGTGKALVRDRQVVQVVPPAYVKPAVERISVTAPVIEAAREVHALIAGADKAEMLVKVLQEPIELDVRPIGMLRSARGVVRWLLDQAAAAKLPK
jgi:6-phosphogluconolactonase